MANTLASISLDLDNAWSYRKTSGAQDWEQSRSYLPLVVPRILKLLKEHNQRITFFIVGRDAADPVNAEALRSIAEAGHEIANHSWLHEPWLHLYSEAELHEELAKTENALQSATGQHPKGFRGPGFSSSPTLRQVLRDRGYVYDASRFPSILGPLARAYFMATSQLPAEEKAKRSKLHGNFSDALGSLRPYHWENGLLEIPVTTMPILRLPTHFTYLMFLAKVSPLLAKAYWKTASILHRIRSIPPSLLLHPTDFLDLNDAPELAFFPAMTVAHTTKMDLVSTVIKDVQAHWKLASMGDAAASLPADALPQAFNTTRPLTH